MDLWPGVDVALRFDGHGGVAGLARGRLEKTTSATGAVSFSMAVECAVDAALFWDASFRSGLRGNSFTLAGAGDDALVILAREASRRRFARSLSGLGDLCRHAELHHLAA